MRVLFATGGTGGHIMPVIAVKEQLEILAQERNFEVDFLFVGHVDEVGRNLLEEHNIPYRLVYAGKIRRYFSIENLTDVFKAIKGLIMAQWYVWKYMPDVTFGKGGYASVPGVLVSWLYQVPIVIHESDSLPGLANTFLGRFATIIAVAFPKVKEHFPAKKTTLVGNMTHSDIRQGDRDAARERFKLTYEKPVVLIIGGSQGAQRLNALVWEVLPRLTQWMEVIHVVGPRNVKQAETFYRSLDTYQSRFYHYAGFLTHELKHAYAASDLIISRAGASSIADICLNEKPSILIPITIDAGQQRSNAYEMAEIGASIVLEEPNLTPSIFLSQIEELIKQPNLMDAMGQRSANFATPDAARYLAEQVLEISD